MAKKENEFTSIEISKKDRERLFELSMKIRGLNNNKECIKPAAMVHHAVNALEAEVSFFENIHNEKEVSSKTLN